MNKLNVADIKTKVIAAGFGLAAESEADMLRRLEDLLLDGIAMGRDVMAQRCEAAEQIIAKLTMDHNTTPNYLEGLAMAQKHFADWPNSAIRTESHTTSDRKPETWRSELDRLADLAQIAPRTGAVTIGASTVLALRAELSRLQAENEALRDSVEAKADRIDRLGEMVERLQAGGRGVVPVGTVYNAGWTPQVGFMLAGALDQKRVREGDKLWVHPPAAPALVPLSEDGQRCQWLRERFIGADFDWNDSGESVLVFKIEQGTKVWGDFDLTIDAARNGLTVGDGGAKG